MTTSQESDAIALWQDALTLLAERNVAPATLAMLRSCQAISFDGEKLTVSTNMGFAQRKISQQAPMIEECLEQAAFQPVGFEVILTHDSVRRSGTSTRRPRRWSPRRHRQTSRPRA